MALAFYSQNNKIKPLALHEYMEKKKNEARTRAKRTGGSGSQSVAVVVPIDD
jgi:hypothetical protein